MLRLMMLVRPSQTSHSCPQGDFFSVTCYVVGHLLQFTEGRALWNVQDHYENIYAVVKGRKLFTLLPPSDAYRLYFQTCQVARYRKDAEGTLVLQPEEPHHVSMTALHLSTTLNQSGSFTQA